MVPGAFTTDEYRRSGTEGLAHGSEVGLDRGVLGGIHDADPDGPGPESFGRDGNFVAGKIGSQIDGPPSFPGGNHRGEQGAELMVLARGRGGNENRRRWPGRPHPVCL